jgi:hypothetical protein
MASPEARRLLLSPPFQSSPRESRSREISGRAHISTNPMTLWTSISLDGASRPHLASAFQVIRKPDIVCASWGQPREPGS